MPAIRFKGVDYTTPTVYVQSDASATDLENTKVPTGQTIKSYLNSNMYEIDWEPTSSSTLVDLFNQHRGKHSFPISIAKSGSVSITDLPASYQQSEFTCLIVGNVVRATAICMIYNATVQIIFFRQFFNGSWRSSWTKISTSSV